MRNRFIIFVSFATVLQGVFASSVVEGIDAASDIQVAYEKSNELWTRTVEVLFDAIEDNLPSEHAKEEYFELALSGYNYFFAAVPSYSPNDTLQDLFSNDLKNFVDILFQAVDLAKSMNETYLDTLTNINAIHTNLNFQSAFRRIFELIQRSSIAIWTEATANLNMIYINIFAAMVSRAALNFGFLNEIPPSFKDRVLAGTRAVSWELYSFARNEPNHFCVSDVIASIISNTSGITPLKYFPRSFQEHIYRYCWTL